ncbi:IS3 family transposase [Gottfriedia acidiceleris]|uniref:IS3 family transposase n=1 Tax=Gottfriedia acidiceleris TaxID=371036 RepID=UPI003B58B210
MLIKHTKSSSQHRLIISLELLKLEVDDYINWFNHQRIYGTLGYLSPVEFRKRALKKTV